MSAESFGEDAGAEIVPLHPAVPAPDPQLHAVPAETSYEIHLDEAPPAGPPVHVDAASPAASRLPVVPHHLRTRAGVQAAAARHAAGLGHRAAFHGIRSPRYLLLAIAWAVVGVLRVAALQIGWWWHVESHSLRSEAVIAGDSREYMRLHKEAKEVRQFRGAVLLAEVAVLAAGVGLAVTVAPWWAGWLAVAVVLPLLAIAGRGAGRRIITPATVTPRFRKLSADIVLRAYYAAGLGHPEKPDQQVTFGSTMQRDGDGSRVLVDLPYGKGLSHAVRAREDIASGLDVQVSQLFLHRDPSSHRRHTLWVADRDPLAVPVGRTPLLACRPTDIWSPAPLGLDERGQLVSVLLMWNSVLVSALPRSGKTFAARLLALYCALDPFVTMDVFDFKGSPDWRKFALIADSCAFGLTPSRAGLPLQIFGDTLEAIKDDVQDRYHRLSELPADVCPEGKLTREIARDKRFRMPVRVLVLEEFQEVYDLGDQSKEMASLLTYLVKVAPGAGVILVASTQRPSGVGSGQVAQQFTSFRDNFAIRFGLRTSSWQVSELCLGAGAYSEGLDTSQLLPQYKGVGILRGTSDASPTVRSYLADGQDAEWPALAERLSSGFPDRWADATAEVVSAECRPRGVASVDVKAASVTLKGCRRAAVEKAASR